LLLIEIKSETIDGEEVVLERCWLGVDEDFLDVDGGVGDWLKICPK
jgi:hypothetical protein